MSDLNIQHSEQMQLEIVWFLATVTRACQCETIDTKMSYVNRTANVPQSFQFL